MNHIDGVFMMNVDMLRDKMVDEREMEQLQF